MTSGGLHRGTAAYHFALCPESGPASHWAQPSLDDEVDDVGRRRNRCCDYGCSGHRRREPVPAGSVQFLPVVPPVGSYPVAARPCLLKGTNVL